MPPSDERSVAERQLRSIPGKDYEKEEAELDREYEVTFTLEWTHY